MEIKGFDKEKAEQELLRKFFFAVETLKNGFLELEQFEEVPSSAFEENFKLRSNIDEELSNAFLNLSVNERKKTVF